MTDDITEQRRDLLASMRAKSAQTFSTRTDHNDNRTAPREDQK